MRFEKKSIIVIVSACCSKVVHDLRAVEEVLAPASRVDLGSDLSSVAKLQENFNSAKPQFLVGYYISHLAAAFSKLPHPSIHLPLSLCVIMSPYARTVCLPSFTQGDVKWSTIWRLTSQRHSENGLVLKVICCLFALRPSTATERGGGVFGEDV